MPGKNTIKQFIGNSYYHLYNRGNNKQSIFLDDQDYRVFLSYLKTYLVPKDEKALQDALANPDTPWSEKDKVLKLLRLNNFFGSITLVSYCLMPNHFHLLVHQKEERDIDRFMNSLGTRYTMYCNRKQKRVGPLFQSLYKAVFVETDEQLLHLSRYIHRNPLELPILQGTSLQNYEYSSYKDYLGLRRSEWVGVEYLLSYFASSQWKKSKAPDAYQAFVMEKEINESSIEVLKHVMLDE